MAKTMGQLNDGVTDLKSFEKMVADKLKYYPFLNWKTVKTQKLCKKLYNKGYNIDDTIGFIILNSK